MTRDPIGYNSDKVHLYRFCRARPIALVDPTGKASITTSIVSWRHLGQTTQPFAIGVLHLGTGSNEVPMAVAKFVVCVRKHKIKLLCKKVCDSWRSHHVTFYHKTSVGYQYGQAEVVPGNSAYMIYGGAGSPIENFINAPFSVVDELWGDGIPDLTFSPIFYERDKAHAACRSNSASWGPISPKNNC